MSDKRIAVGLKNRGVIRVSGEDARGFLDSLITTSMANVRPSQAIHTALLTPQGKIITDFFVTEALLEDGGGFYCDVPLVAVSELTKRLGFYRLRAKATIEDMSGALGIVVIWDEDGNSNAESEGPSPMEVSLSFADPRLDRMGHRIMVHHSQREALVEAIGAREGTDDIYHRRRATAGLGEAGFDFALNDAFPHEINMDQLGGVDFRKGCYIGQEVVSRMQHRGTARTRLVPLQCQNGFSLAEGIPVMAGSLPIGVTGTAGEGMNLAMLRLDRAADALTKGTLLTAGAVNVVPEKPAWWTAHWPIAPLVVDKPVDS